MEAQGAVGHGREANAAGSGHGAKMVSGLINAEHT
jgi:hypothetical protein